MARILTNEQAEAVFNAMYALNTVGARLDTFLENQFHAREMSSGFIVIHKGAQMEMYESQQHFVEAYGISKTIEPIAEVAENFVFILRNQPDGKRWPVGTKLYLK